LFTSVPRVGGAVDAAESIRERKELQASALVARLKFEPPGV
jgi:hypothetical protein